MFWANRVAKEIINSGKYKPYWVDDMKTPSGRIHVGSLRGPVIHDLLYKAFLAQGVKSTFTYCINDMDPMDGFPEYLPREKFYKYMGWPLFKIPSPVTGFSSFSQFYAKEFIEVFNKIGCLPQIIWTSNLYAEGKFDKLIRIFLDNTDKVRKLFKEQYKNFKEEEYYPYQPICPSCGKIATTKIYKWDGEYVYFECNGNEITYTRGCGFKGKVKPEKQNGKMPWKIEWSAHWKTLGVTVEWSGKDHMTEGGSHEIASKICEKILNYPTPYAQSYEHLLLGGKKMSSSKGIGSSAKEISDILPPYLLRFLFVRINYRETIDFDPVGTMVIPDLFDEYDRCWNAYITGSDENLSSAYVMSQIDKLPPKKPVFLPRFRDVANYLQLANVDLVQKFTEIKGEKLLSAELAILQEREKYAKVWLENFAPSDIVYTVNKDIPKETGNLSASQKEYLSEVALLLEKKNWQADELQQELYQLSKKKNIPVKEAFAAIYLSLIGKTHGPKAAWFLLDQDKKFIIERFKNV